MKELFSALYMWGARAARATSSTGPAGYAKGKRGEIGEIGTVDGGGDTLGNSGRNCWVVSWVEVATVANLWVQAFFLTNECVNRSPGAHLAESGS